MMFDTEERTQQHAEFTQELLKNRVADFMAILQTNAENEYPGDVHRQAALIGAASRMAISMIVICMTKLHPQLSDPDIEQQFNELTSKDFARARTNR